MTDHDSGADRILGELGVSDGTGVVRVSDRYATDIDDLWSAVTDPARIARWLGEVEGDLEPGGRFTVRLFASGWEGSGRVLDCEPPRRFVVLTAEPGEATEHRVEATLTADGDHTVLVIEERGVPADQLAPYGAGNQVHLEDLAAYLAGRDRVDARARWEHLLPAYQDLVPAGR